MLLFLLVCESLLSVVDLETNGRPLSQTRQNMAEELRTGSMVGVDTPDGTLLHSGEVSYKGKAHKLHLTPRGLRLVESNNQSNATAAAASVPVIDVEWIDVLYACVCEASKRKSTPHVSDSVFVVHYIHRKANNKLSCKSVTLDTKKESAQSWISQIMEKCKEGKPQKLLIVINPIGGKGTSPQTFEKEVRHIFDLAGVEVIVKVTERAKHAVEIAKTFAVSTVDGVIAMGGDGMYMEIIHGLTLRKQEEEGIDFNDPEAKLVSPTVRVGIIPTGTGNAATKWLNGVLDIETAVLNIIRGEIGWMNIFSIFEPGKLISYAGVLLANGIFSAVLQRTDELRWMRRARYPYAFLESTVKKKKFIEFNIEFLKHETDSKNEPDDLGDGARAATSGWTNMGSRQLVGIIGYPSSLLEDGEQMKIAPFYPSFDMFLIKTGSIWENIKFFSRLINIEKRVMEMENFEPVRGIVGIRFEMIEKGQEEASTKQQEKLTELGKLLDVDGELFKLSVPKFEARLHPHFLQVYCAPALYECKTTSET